jgi:hypothetical protein
MSYFSEESVAEGRAKGGIRFVLLALGRMYAPPQNAQTGSQPLAERKEEIPDEIYTLW